MGILKEPLSSLQRIPEISDPSSGAQPSRQATLKPVASSGLIGPERAAINPPVLSRISQGKDSSSLLRLTCGWRPQAGPSRSSTAPIPQPPMFGQNLGNTTKDIQESLVVVGCAVEPSAFSHTKGRTPPHDLQVSKTIPKEQQ